MLVNILFAIKLTLVNRSSHINWKWISWGYELLQDKNHVLFNFISPAPSTVPGTSFKYSKHTLDKWTPHCGATPTPFSKFLKYKRVSTALSGKLYLEYWHQKLWTLNKKTHVKVLALNLVEGAMHVSSHIPTNFIEILSEPWTSPSCFCMSVYFCWVFFCGSISCKHGTFNSLGPIGLLLISGVGLGCNNSDIQIHAGLSFKGIP